MTQRVIHILPEQVASQIAAGEVVERPASAVKELIENSLDAGARNLAIEIERGGLGLISVTDDGCGMTREDAILSLRRHATSKIRAASDLIAIRTLGFRGEALASIASVAKMKVQTRQNADPHGIELVIARRRHRRGARVRDGGRHPHRGARAVLQYAGTAQVHEDHRDRAECDCRGGAAPRAGESRDRIQPQRRRTPIVFVSARELGAGARAADIRRQARLANVAILAGRGAA